MSKIVTREEFDAACEAVWSEFQYQNALSRRTDDEAVSVMDFVGLARRYARKAEDDWADNPGELQPEGLVRVPAALHGLRKLTTIFMRGMIYNGIRKRQ